MAASTLAVKDGAGVAKALSAQADASGALIPVHTTDTNQAIYQYAKSAHSLAVATPTATVVIQGSATKTVRIKRIEVGGAATAYGSMPVVLTRRSTAGTLGSAQLTAVTAAKRDTGSADPSAVVSTVGTANYTTLGTAVAVVGAGRVNFTALGSAATSSAEVPTVFDFSDGALVLRGAAEWVTIDLGGAAVPAGAVLDLNIVTVEDAS